ncbi:MAG TPA: DUF979 family protein [Kofleriaceae bacterium]|nr:DUF979 family protein [Kofleriaceae bacterium]
MTWASLFDLEIVYVMTGAVLIVFAGFTLADRENRARVGTALFWLLLGIVFALGSHLPAWLNGVLVIALVAIDGAGQVRQGGYREAAPATRAASAERLGLLLFLPVLLIPIVTFAATEVFDGPGFVANDVLYAGLGLSSVLAAAAALLITRAKPIWLVHDGRRLADAIGAVMILPQLLAALGELFKAAGVGKVIASGITAVIPTGSLFAVVLVCCTSVALFTFIMGNSFAAFPVIMAGIGVPLLIEPFGVDPALVGLLTITVASCGTLCTPMAANFNLVPPALLEMRDRYGVIKAQAPVAAIMFVTHVLLLWGMAAFDLV